MTVETRVGPDVLTINRGSTFMVTDMNGEIDQTKSQGLFAEDTRFISTYQLYINDQPWQRVASATVTYYAARLDLLNPEVRTPDGRGVIEAQTIGLTLERQINTGLGERFHVANFSMKPVNFMLEIVIRSDFATLFQVKAGHLTRRGDMLTRWDERRCTLTTNYRNQDFVRRLVYRVEHSTTAPHYANGRLVFHLVLDPGATWDAKSEVLLEHQGRKQVRRDHRAPRDDKADEAQEVASGALLEQYQEDWIKSCTVLETPNHTVRETYRQCVEDMGCLRLPEHDLGPDMWLPAAGVPWFVALFGRDSLIASYQNMMIHAPFAEGALRELANYQAKTRDDYRDTQPGKIMHELRHGELAYFHEVPFTPYYGTADATILYLMMLHEAYRWTANRKLIEDLQGVADLCLEWIDTYGDLDGDGFQEWKTFSSDGFENMGWKDSGTSIVYGDGTQTKQPKGTCELQAYVYDAKLRMAELYDDLGQAGRAQRLRSQAADLAHHFNESFWMEKEGCYALGLDADKRQIDAVASNTGQVLWSGIAPPERAKRIAARLFQDDMWSGWGIRTLSAKNPAYNPFSYQRGAIWPHDNGIIAAGLKRYGFTDEVNRIAEGIFAAAARFDTHRLPEVFAGLKREPPSFPAQYLGANIPQAWAAGSIFHLLRTMLGLRADAPNRVLYVDPSLPDWLPELELSNLKVGDARVDIRFWREGGGCPFEVQSISGGRLEVKLESEDTLVSRTLGPNREELSSMRHLPAGEGETPAPKRQAKAPPIAHRSMEENPPPTSGATASAGPPAPGHSAAQAHDTEDQRRSEGTSGG